MDESKTPPTRFISCRYLTLCRGVLDLSIIQGPFSITKCQTLLSRFATFSSQYGGASPQPVALGAAHPALGQPLTVTLPAGLEAGSQVSRVVAAWVQIGRSAQLIWAPHSIEMKHLKPKRPSCR